MALLILKILATVVLAWAGLVMTWVTFVGISIAHDTKKFGLGDYTIILVVPGLFILSLWAMWS